MATKKTVKVEGLRELDAALGKLSKASARGVLRRVLKKAGQPIADAASRLAPDNPNGPVDDLKRSITVSARLGNKVGKAEYHEAMKAGLGKGAAVAAMRAARRAAAGTGSFAEMHVGPEYGRNSRVGALQEFGTKNHPPHPFMRPAFDAEGGAALEIIKRELGGEIAKAVARKAKRDARIAAKKSK